MKILKKGDVVRKRQVERTKIERRVLGNVEHPFLMRLHYAFQVCGAAPRRYSSVFRSVDTAP